MVLNQALLNSWVYDNFTTNLLQLFFVCNMYTVYINIQMDCFRFSLSLIDTML